MTSDNNVTLDNPYIWNPDTDFTPIETITRKKANKQSEQLRNAIHEHDRRYYNEGNPIISDSVYDQLFKRLQKLEHEFNLHTENSPTTRVGGSPVDDFETVEHVKEMLSIEQSKEREDVEQFNRRVKRESNQSNVAYMCEPKFDGISIALYYENGELLQAVTRGDGEFGDDVTRNARTVRDIPLTLSNNPPEFLVVRGELFIPKDQFQNFNKHRIQQNKDPFANPRNATAGTMRQQDPSVVANRPLAFYAFEVLDASERWDSRMAEHQAFQELGLPVSDEVELADNIEDAITYRDRLLEQRDELNVEIDGVVLKVNDRPVQEQLGTTSNHPRWAFAYKFPPRAEETILRNIALQVGRTGRITPVALLDPVDVGGVTVSRASLHNPEQIQEIGVDVGDKVRVERAGDVIPQVVETISDKSGSVFSFPDACPICNSTIERDGPIARCTGGLSCSAQQQRRIEYYTSRTGLDIEGLGEETIQVLIEEGLISNIADLYEISSDDIAKLEGFGETSADNIIQAINEARETRLDEFLTALGIREVGPTVAKTIAYHFDCIDDIRNASVHDLEQVEDIGPVTINRINEFFNNDANMRVLDRLLTHVQVNPLDVDRGDAFDNTTVVFTGSLPTMTRSAASEIIEREGGTVTGSVSGNTDILVIGENPGSTKQNKADELGVSTESGEVFEDRLQQYK